MAFIFDEGAFQDLLLHRAQLLSSERLKISRACGTGMALGLFGNSLSTFVIADQFLRVGNPYDYS